MQLENDDLEDNDSKIEEAIYVILDIIFILVVAIVIVVGILQFEIDNPSAFESSRPTIFIDGDEQVEQSSSQE